jgi:hypothetical protein
VGDRASDPTLIGWYYIANNWDAPVVEIDCGSLTKGREGRIYWAKYFSTPAGLQYNVEDFSKWFDQILRWIRKNGRKMPADKQGAYLLQDARSAKASLEGRA